LTVPDLVSTGRAPLRVALSTPALRRCQLAPAVARLVDMATLVAVSVHLFSIGGARAVAPFVVVRTLAPAFGTPLVLAATGRHETGRVLTVCAAVAGLSAAALAVAVSSDSSVFAIVVLGGLSGAALGCIRPLVVALLPQHLVGPSALLATNSMAALADNASTLVGPLLAGAALATLGPAAALWASAALLAVTAVFVRGLRGASADDALDDARKAPVVRFAIEGVRVLHAQPQLRLVTLLAGAQTFVRGALNVLVVGLAIDLLELGDGGVGLLLGAIGVGGLVGLPVAVRLAHGGGLGRGLGIAVVLWGAPIALAAGVPLRVVTIGLFVVIGVGNSLVDISADTLLQRLVKRSQLPSVLGAFDAVLFLTMAAGAVVAERLLSLVGLRSALVVIGLILPAMAVGSWRMLKAVDEQMRERDQDARLLQFHGIFSPLVMSTIDHLATAMDREEFAAGDVILRKGEVGDRYLLIESGTVEIVDDGVLLAVLESGDGFGEMALLDAAPRNATAIARSAVCVRTVRRMDFLVAVRSHGLADEALNAVAEQRRR
jgi:hypothetical protein